MPLIKVFDLLPWRALRLLAPAVSSHNSAPLLYSSQQNNQSKRVSY